MTTGPDSDARIPGSGRGEPDIVIYPDSRKVGVNDRRPNGTGLKAMFRVSDSVEHYHGEEPPDA